MVWNHQTTSSSEKFNYQDEDCEDDEETIYGGCLHDVILFSDGRVVILNIPEADIDNYDNLVSLTSRMPEFVNDFYYQYCVKLTFNRL